MYSALTMYRCRVASFFYSADKMFDGGDCRAVVYLIQNTSGATYVGSTTDVVRRLRQHDGLISGGSRQTRARGPWRVEVVVSGFLTWKDALRFEFAWRRCCRRVTRVEDQMKWRRRGLEALLMRQVWSSTSRPVCEVSVTVHARKENVFDSEIKAHSNYGSFARVEF